MRFSRMTWLLLFAPLAALAAAPPGPLHFQTLGVADGLPSSDVYKLAQGPSGFIWMATHDGLVRYDGVDMLVYRQDATRAGSGAGNDIEALFADKDGRIWCGGEGSGLLRLDPGASKFFAYRHVPNDTRTLGSNDVFAVSADGAGTVWVGTYLGGLNALQADDSFLHIDHDDDDPDSLSSSTVFSLYPDAQGRLWIGTDKGLDVRDRDGRIHHVAMPPFQADGDSLQVFSFLPQIGGSVLVGTERGIARIDPQLRFGGQAYPEQRATMSLLHEPPDITWIGKSNGLVKVTATAVTSYQPIEGVVGMVPGRRVIDMLRDHEGGIWFAFLDGGVARLPPHWQNFSAFPHIPGVPTSLTHGDVRGVSVDDDGALWAISAVDGLDRIDGTTGVVTRHGDWLGKANSRLTSVLALGDELWLGHRDGINIVDRRNGRLKKLAVDPASDKALPAGRVLQLRVGGDGAVWALMVGAGVARIDPQGMLVHSYLASAHGVADADIKAIAIDNGGKPWLATASGVERLDAPADRFVAVAGSPRETIDTMEFEPDGTLWIHRPEAIEQFRVDADGLTSLRRFKLPSGLVSGYVHGMHLAYGMLWMASGMGLWRLDTANGTLRRFGEADGLPSAEFEQRTFTVAANGTVWAGTRSGVVAFDPATIDTSLPQSPLRIASVTVRRNGGIVNLDFTRLLSIKHDDRDLTIAARVLSFANVRANRYRFKLSGFDKDWIDSGERGERMFSQLPAGHYRLLVEGANPNDVWTRLVAPLEIRVNPAPWLSPWAYAAYVLAALAFIALAFRSYRLRIRRRHTFQLALERQRSAEQVGNAKSSFLATMAHEIRTPLTGVLGMTDLLLRSDLDERQRGQAGAIRSSGELLMRVVNDCLDLARIEAGKLALEARSFAPRVLVAEVAAVFEGVAQSKSLDVSMHIDPDIPAHVHGDPVRIKQILLNLVGNAVKFTERGRVVIGVAPEADDRLRFRVEDSGPGMSADTRSRLFERFEQSAGIADRYGGSGLGLAICHELVELMGGEIRVDSQLGRGTEFVVLLPLPAVAAADPRQIENLKPSGTSPDPAATGQRRSLHILLVEDDTIVAQVIAGLLEHAGHRCFHAINGLVALAELARSRFDLALIDLDLPGIDGLSLARMLRARRESSGHKLPLIAVTARSGGNEEALVRAAAMDGFLRKPLVPEHLFAAIDAAVDPQQPSDSAAG